MGNSSSPPPKEKRSSNSTEFFGCIRCMMQNFERYGVQTFIKKGINTDSKASYDLFLSSLCPPLHEYPSEVAEGG